MIYIFLLLCSLLVYRYFYGNRHSSSAVLYSLHPNRRRNIFQFFGEGSSSGMPQFGRISKNILELLDNSSTIWIDEYNNYFLDVYDACNKRRQGIWRSFGSDVLGNRVYLSLLFTCHQLNSWNHDFLIHLKHLTITYTKTK